MTTRRGLAARGLAAILLSAALAASGCQGGPDREDAASDGEGGIATDPGAVSADAGETPGAQRALSLDQEAGTLTAEDGTPIPILEGAVNGSVDHWTVDGGTAQLSGWAAAVERSEPAELVVIVRNGDVVAASAPNLHREDVAEYFDDPALSASGFEIPFPAQDGMEVTVYGVAGNSASELPYVEGYPWQAAAE